MGRQEVTAEELLVTAFLSMQPASTLIALASDVGGGTISANAQRTLFSKCLENEVHVRYPSSKAYIRGVLKNIILAAEQEGNEVLDDLYNMHASFCPAGQQLTERCYKTFTFTIADDTMINLRRTLGDEAFLKAVESNLVTLRVSLNMLDGDTGYSVWPAGFLLTEFLISYPEVVHGYSCLELGSGTGMCGVWLSRFSCSKVVLTDGSLSTLVNLRHNLSINGVGQPADEDSNSTGKIYNPLEVECRQMLWETVSQAELDRLNAEVILGADLIYDPTVVPHLVRVLAGLLRPKSNFEKDVNCHASNVSDNVQAVTVCLSHTSTSLDGCQSEEGSTLEVDREAYPVAYIATAIRNLTTLELFYSLVFQAGLELVDVTESMRPTKCLPELFGFDRDQIKIHKLFYLSS